MQLPGKTKSAVKLSQSKFVGASVEGENKTVTVTVKFVGIDEINDLVLHLLFSTQSLGYYSFTKVTYVTNGETDYLWANQDIHFPYNFSYHCSPKMSFTNNSVSLEITDMQFQIDPKNSTERAFDDAYDCVCFTSIPIWTGIFVTAILALIMIWALTMIMDIRTMDRFDDPKGKTITISAAD